MTTTLITGAGTGLGREAARQLIAAGHTVWLSGIDDERDRGVAEDLGGRYVSLDVTCEETVAAARTTISAAGEGLDVLINNAGAGGGRIPIDAVTADAVQLTFAVNVFGVIRVTQAMIPLLEHSADPVIVNVSSGMGSFGVTADPQRLESTLIGLAYPSSKSALNMITVMYAKAYPQMKINAVDPGQTATAMTGGHGQPVEQGAEVIVQAAQQGREGASGSFLAREGPLPW